MNTALTKFLGICPESKLTTLGRRYCTDFACSGLDKMPNNFVNAAMNFYDFIFSRPKRRGRRLFEEATSYDRIFL